MSANWSLWADVPHTELWRAVALSMDIEPVDLPGFDRSCIRDPIFNYPFHQCPEEFRRRLEIARKHLGHKLMPISFSHSDWNSEVSLMEMRTWAAALNNPWDFPAKYPQATSLVVCPLEQPERHEEQFTQVESKKEKETVDKRNMRWFRIWEDEGGYVTRGAQSAAIKRIMESEGVTNPTAKSGIQRGQKLVAEMRREGRARSAPQTPSNTDPFGWGNKRRP